MSDLKAADLKASLVACALAIAALEAKLVSSERENAFLRVIAETFACPYGHRSAAGLCELGYPGCACMDDFICATSYPPHTPSEAYQARLERRASGLQERVRIAASHFHSMAEGFTRAREPSKAAACQGMADLMEDRL